MDLEQFHKILLEIAFPDRVYTRTQFIGAAVRGVFYMVEKDSRPGFAERFIPSKNDPPNVRKLKIVSIVAALVFVTAMSILAVYFIRVAQNRMEIEEQRKRRAEAEISVITQATTTDPVTETEEPVETEPPPLVMRPFFESFIEENPDTAGWITVPNTNIDNVVVQTTDNDYYLDKDFHGNKNIAGQIYVDYRCIINDYDKNQTDNVVVYGHNQADQSMFGTLKKYKIKKDNTKNFDFYLQNPTFTFSSLYEEYTYKIIAMFVIEVEPYQTRDGIVFDYHNFVNFTKKRSFDTFSENVMARTAVYTGVDFNKNDKFMTLSTCSNEFEPSRFVVIGRRVRDGESPEVDTSLAELNMDMLEPDYSFIYSR